ncbi:MAG: hypothetical protein JSV88_27795 [Candidatus Aminicenantes bacterium]|nr:MAG: hypothetical protein JSV88_27795 [Candidatus Aminicenantes bacterium]
MNQRRRNRMRMMAMICLAVLCVNFVLLSSQSERIPKKDKAVKRMKHLFFLAEANLFDGRWLLEMKTKVGLTREQQEKIEDLMLKHEAFSIQNSAEIKIKEVRFAAYLKTGKMDRKEMEKHIREISREKTNLIVSYINYLLDVRNVLTSQQLETLRQMKEQKKKGKELHSP